MEHILEQLERGSQPDRHITHEQYRAWQRGYIFDGMRDLRYGQSFCNHFNIWDNILFYNVFSQPEADRYIRETYVR